jgi:alkylmercury lyase
MARSMETGRVLDEGRTLLDAQGHPGMLQRLIGPTYRLLAQGRTVSPAEIAEAADLPLEAVETALRDFGDAEWTPDGRIEGLGLTRRETPHRIRIGEADLHTWCAMDTLIAAAILDRPVRIESPDGATGEPLRLEADGRRILAADPPSIVVSWYVDPSGEGVRAAGCQFGHFFASRESAASWLAKYPQGGILSLDEAMNTGRRFASELFGAAG